MWGVFTKKTRPIFTLYELAHILLIEGKTKDYKRIPNAVIVQLGGLS